MRSYQIVKDLIYYYLSFINNFFKIRSCFCVNWYL